MPVYALNVMGRHRPPSASRCREVKASTVVNANLTTTSLLQSKSKEIVNPSTIAVVGSSSEEDSSTPPPMSSSPPTILGGARAHVTPTVVFELGSGESPMEEPNVPSSLPLSSSTVMTDASTKVNPSLVSELLNGESPMEDTVIPPSLPQVTANIKEPAWKIPYKKNLNPLLQGPTYTERMFTWPSWTGKYQSVYCQCDTSS